MTSRSVDQPGLNPSAGSHPGDDQVTGWSVEAHLATCGRCRSAVSAHVDPVRLARNRDVMLVLVATRDAGRIRRLFSRCGVPDHLLRLLAATPTLRLSWLLSVVGVLAIVAGEGLVAAYMSAGPALPHHAQAPLLFLLVAPLLVLATVAAAFLPWFDPAYALAVAAPFSGFLLLLVRAVCAMATALVPVVAAAFVVPGPRWLSAALLLPSLALCAVALTVTAVVGPRAGAATAGALWAAPVLWVGVARSPQSAVQWHGQAGWAVVLLAAAVVLVVRRDRFEMGWRR
jgi:hypothetical protein